MGNVKIGIIVVGNCACSLIVGIPRGLPRAHYRWGFQRAEAIAFPFGRPRGFKPSGRYSLIQGISYYKDKEGEDVLGLFYEAPATAIYR